jgi:cytochrome c oxidase subunit III
MEREEIITKNKIHPHKLTLWIGIGSIIMMFAGLTSAYIVKRNQAGWVSYDLPMAFWYSTIVILLSSATIYLADKSFRSRAMGNYRRWMTVTAVLGIVFMVIQYVGFKAFWSQGMTLQANVAYSFLYVIVGLHALHVAGGVISLIVMSLMAFSKKKRVYSTVPVELIGTYWHFVDALWIYLLIFLILIR